MGISLAEANKMCEVAIAKADELGIKISVAVCDWGGRLISFDRMRRSILGQRLRVPGQGDGLHGIRPSQCAADGASRPPGPSEASSPRTMVA